MTRLSGAFTASLLVVAMVAGVSIVFKQSPDPYSVGQASDPASQGNGSRRGPLPFPGVIVPLDIVLTQLERRGLTIYLPTRMVGGLQLTAVWAKVLDGEIGFPLLVVYSNQGDTAIATAELVVEIAGGSGISWAVTNSTTDRFGKIGEWTAFITSRAPVGYEEYYLKYHTEFACYVDLQIGALNYLLRFSPVLTAEEATEISASMKPVATQNP